MSLCYKNPNGPGWICSGRGSGGPCDISSQTVATVPTDTSRTTIGVGEQVKITTTGFSLSASGDGTLNTSSSPATLTAGAEAGTVTVSTAGRGTTCSANSITFDVIAPSGSEYYRTGGIAHDYSFADIGIESNIFLAPDTVSFQFLTWEEVQSYASTNLNGSWGCLEGKPHNPGPAVAVGTDVIGQGSKVNTTDRAYTGSCSGVSQFLNSTLSWEIPTQYELTSGSSWYQINTVAQTASDTTAGALTMTKDDHSTGNTTVNSATSYY
jgi:hypothetical protein